MHLSRFVLGPVTTAMILSAARPAAADPTGQDRAAAEALFREGKELVAANKVGEGCAKFAESNRLDPKVGTLLYLAICHEQEGKTATAWGEFTEAFGAAQRAKQPDRAKIAKDHADALEKKLSKLSVTVAAPADGLEVKLDQQPLAAGVLGTALPIDPGEHTLAASAPGRKPWTRAVKIELGPQTTILEVPELASDAPPPPAPPPPPPPAPVEVKSTMSGAKVAGLTALGVGVLGVGAGAVFGVRASALQGAAERDCVGDRCTASALETYDDARSSATVSTIAFGVGVVGVAAATYFFLTASSKRSTAAWRWEPRPATGGAQMAVRF